MIRNEKPHIKQTHQRKTDDEQVEAVAIAVALIAVIALGLVAHYIPAQWRLFIAITAMALLPFALGYAISQGLHRVSRERQLEPRIAMLEQTVRRNQDELRLDEQRANLRKEASLLGQILQDT